MKLKYILIALAVLAFLAGGYFIYQQFYAKKQADLWSFVPAGAVAVFETEELPEVWKKLDTEAAGEVLKGLPYRQKLDNYRQLLDSATENKLMPFFEGRHLLASLHITGNNSFDYVFYIPLRGEKERNILKQLRETFKNDTAFQFSVRTYHEQEIEEFRHTQNNKSFSFFVRENCFVGSFTPFLAEDVIRQLGEDNQGKDFRQEHLPLFKLSKASSGQGKVYINGQKIGAALNLFLRENKFPSGFPFSSKLDISFNQDGVLLNGYTVPEAGSEAPYLQSLLNETPQTFDVANMIPLRTSEVRFYGFSEGGKWHKKLQEKEVLSRWQELKQSWPEAAQVPALLNNRLALASIPNHQGGTGKLLYMHTKNGKEAADQLLKLAGEMMQPEGDSLFQEDFSGYTITELNYPEFPEAVFGPAFAGFGECFFFQMGNYLVLANTTQELKLMIQDMESDNTWQKSVPLYQFMEKINQEVNFGLYLNTGRGWKQLLSAAESGWESYLEQYGPYLRQYNMMALQFSSMDEMFYTNFLLQASPQAVQDLKQLRFSSLNQTLLQSPAATPPMLYVNRLLKKNELLVQDTSQILYLLDGQGNIQKSDSLRSPLVGSLFQLDPRKNGRNEFLAVTRNALFLYDPAFNRRKGFPVYVPEGVALEQANVIDYNGSKMYRILAADAGGDIYMFDMDGNILKGWNPRKLDGSLSVAPGHIRVRGKDIIFAFQQQGTIQMFNRRGSSYAGFPLDLKGRILGDFFIKAGSDFNTTEFTTVTEGGGLITFNLNGKILKRTQLFKPEINSFFMLVPDNRQSGFLIARQSGNRLSILDDQGNLLFEKDYLGDASVIIQFFNFGADKELISVTDPEEEFSFLYDLQGNLLNFEPLNSCCPLEVVPGEDQGGYRVYKNYGNKVSVLKGEE